MRGGLGGPAPFPGVYIAPPAPGAGPDAVLTERIRSFHQRSHQTYGAPRIQMDLKDDGFSVGRKRVARLMREADLQGVHRRKGPKGRKRGMRERSAPDLVNRNFMAQAPDQVWVADITYIPTWAGFLYLAVVIDLCSRKVVGWSMATHLQTELVLNAMDMALQRRRPDGVIHHSDHGCQYTSFAFGTRCREMGVRPSLGSVGDCYDNALCESFFATLECELLDRSTFRSYRDARMAVFAYIEGWYNPIRRHSALGQISPMEFERRLQYSAARESVTLSTETG